MSYTAQVTEIVVYLSTTENLELFEDDLEGHQNLPLKKNMFKGVIIVDIEMIAAKSYRSPDYSRWNGWQSIVFEFECGDDWMDKADGNSQCLETHDTMRKTTESERKAKDQITEQPTIPYATEDDDIESQVRASLRPIPWNQRLRTKC